MEDSSEIKIESRMEKLRNMMKVKERESRNKERETKNMQTIMQHFMLQLGGMPAYTIRGSVRHDSEDEEEDSEKD